MKEKVIYMSIFEEELQLKPVDLVLKMTHRQSNPAFFFKILFLYLKPQLEVD